MLRPRIIPTLLLRNQGLVKTVNFKNPVYIGDPVNAVKIFNDKGADELVILDIDATVEGKKPRLDIIAQIASEAFMPLGYGGGIRNLTDIKDILSIGIEKVIVNSYALENPAFITAASDLVGSQSIVVAIDVKKSLWGKYEVVTHAARRKTGLDPAVLAIQMEKAGAGEIIVNSVDRDGTMKGYDIELVKRVANAVSVPVIASGGAGHIGDLVRGVVEGGASAVTAGSMFVFQGRHRAVLITYPSDDEIEKAFGGNKS